MRCRQGLSAQSASGPAGPAGPLVAATRTVAAVAVMLGGADLAALTAAAMASGPIWAR